LGTVSRGAIYPRVCGYGELFFSSPVKTMSTCLPRHGALPVWHCADSVLFPAFFFCFPDRKRCWPLARCRKKEEGAQLSGLEAPFCQALTPSRRCPLRHGVFGYFDFLLQRFLPIPEIIYTSRFACHPFSSIKRCRLRLLEFYDLNLSMSCQAVNPPLSFLPSTFNTDARNYFGPAVGRVRRSVVLVVF